MGQVALRIFTGLVAVGMLAAAAAAAAAGSVPLPKPRPAETATNTIGSSSAIPAPPASSEAPRFTAAQTLSTSPADLAALKEAITAARRGNIPHASELQSTIADPLARKLVEWSILRNDDSETNELARYTTFISENPSWPAMGLLRRRAEATLWSERPDPAVVRSFFGKDRPVSAKGKFALARALLLQGERSAAQSLVREAWRNDAFAVDVETPALDIFSDLITTADHNARMDMQLYAEDVEGGLRAANRAGGNAPVIAKAWIAVIRKASNAKALLDAVPADARHDIGYIYSRAQLLSRGDHATEAAQLILSIPHDHGEAIDADRWWVERRLIARKLLDAGDAKTAYRVVRDAALPSRENYRAEQQFTAGFIALRYLHDPAGALAHFARIAQGIHNPIALARSGYWQGRAADAMGRKDEAHAHYEAAARYSTAYYGQIARAKLGYKEISLRPAPEAREGHGPVEVERAIELLYAIDEPDLVAGALADLGERSSDVLRLAELAELAARHKDARSTALVGKAALGRGLPLEHYAFPVIGIPDYRPIGPTVEAAVIYAIARQESTFNPKTVSSARAMGLMQVTPAAARYIAGKYHAAYDEKRLLSDQSYNVQLGAAELGELIQEYRGSYILTFVGYNAGRGRVKEWIAKHGDPRDPKVDPIDWVERIPFSETRNYVQRVMENLQVYRVRFGGGSKLLIEADLRRGAASN